MRNLKRILIVAALFLGFALASCKHYVCNTYIKAAPVQKVEKSNV